MSLLYTWFLQKMAAIQTTCWKNRSDFFFQKNLNFLQQSNSSLWQICFSLISLTVLLLYIINPLFIALTVWPAVSILLFLWPNSFFVINFSPLRYSYIGRVFSAEIIIGKSQRLWKSLNTNFDVRNYLLRLNQNRW
jgi:hypothetical protein